MLNFWRRQSKKRPLQPSAPLPSVTAFWRQNLVVVWISQFISLMAFSLSVPFTPFYIRFLGVSAEADVKLYSALAAALGSLTFATMAPIWGVLSDRFGRKAMLLRANFGGMVVLGLMGMAPSVGFFVFMRMMQGMFTGTMSAAMTLVSCGTPKHRQGFALGVLSAGVYSGDMTGQFIGGVLVEWYGYRNAFFMSSFFLMLSGLLVAWLVRETFIPPPKTPRKAQAGPRFAKLIETIRPCMPLYVMLSFMMLARVLDNSQMPIFVEMLNGGVGVAGAARWTGRVAGVASLGAMLSGLLIGRLLDRLPPARVAQAAAIGAACVMGLIAVLPPALLNMERIEFLGSSVAPAVLMLLPLRFLMIFCSAGLEPVPNYWLSQIPPAEKKGIIFGFAVTWRSIGSVLGPLLGGLISIKFGVTAIFFIGPLLFLLLVPITNWSKKTLALQESTA